MADFGRQARETRVSPRERRNSQRWASVEGVVVAPLSINDQGQMELVTGAGTAVDGDTLVVDLATDPGLEFVSGDLKALVQDVLAIDASGILLNYGTGLENDGSDNLQVTLAPFDTDDLSEGVSNLYYTDERVDDRVAVLIQDGTGLTWTYDDTAGTLTGDVSLGSFDTDDISEGASNFYFTDERAQDAVGLILTDTASIDFTYDDGANTISAAVLPGGVNHNSLLNYDSNEHVDHTAVNINAGTALTGGGDISASRTLNVDETAINHDNLSGFVANEHVNHSGVNLTAGDGLTGGGDITASRSFALDLATGGHLSFSSGQLQVDDDFLLNTGDTITGLLTFNGGSTAYALGEVAVDGRFAVQNQNSGTAAGLNFYTADGDGTDFVALKVFGKGLPDDHSDNLRLALEYHPSIGEFQVYSRATGVETPIPLLLSVGSNLDQVRLQNDGSTEFQAGSKFDSNGDLVLQNYTNASRPAAGTPGRMIFNTDDGQLNVDDGTNWTLPDGTTT